MSQQALTMLPESLVRAAVNGDGIGTAVEYAKLGIPVLPIYTIEPDGTCSCGEAGCAYTGKHPWTKYAPNGVRSASADPQEVQQVFALIRDANIGLAMGNGLVALDIDPRNGGRLADRYGAGNTVTERTGGWGEHRFYRTGRARPRSHLVDAGAELKGQGQYIVTSPSVHSSGRRYALDPSLLTIATAPTGWLAPRSGPARRVQENIGSGVPRSTRQDDG